MSNRLGCCRQIIIITLEEHIASIRETADKRHPNPHLTAKTHTHTLSLFQLKGYGVSVLTGVDPNADNFVSAGIVNTRSTLIGCLLRLEPNKETKVRYTLHFVTCAQCDMYSPYYSHLRYCVHTI